MSCDEVRELIGAYVLDAVSDADRAAIEDHLAGCTLHDELASLRAAALALGAAAPQREPSPELGERILRAAQAERPPAPAAPRQAQRFETLRSYRALAAVLAVVAVGLAAWVALLLATGGEERDLLTYSYRGRGGETTLLIQTVVGEAPATVVADGLRPLDDGTYHLWAIRGDRWLRVAFFNANPEGSWRGEVDFVFEPTDEVAVTIGSAEGDDRPTQEPLFRSPI